MSHLPTASGVGSSIVTVSMSSRMICSTGCDYVCIDDVYKEREGKDVMIIIRVMIYKERKRERVLDKIMIRAMKRAMMRVMRICTLIASGVESMNV